MILRDEFEKWFSDNHVRAGETINLQMKAYMWAGFQGARAQGGQGVEVVDGKGSLPWFVRVYNSGYEAGHHDTVEGGFTPIHHSDVDTYHAEQVLEILEDLQIDTFQNAQPQPAQQWAASGVEYDRAIHHNPDAKAWADLFMQTFPHCGADPETMHGWFANAMMAMYDHLKNSQPAVPEGLPEWVFDSYAVYECLSVKAQHRTSTENVSDTLDAIKTMLMIQPPKES